MSLDVTLYTQRYQPLEKTSGIFIREDGQTKEITREEWDMKFPGKEPFVFKQDESELSNKVFEYNITHNLGRMAREAGIYQYLWRPEELGITRASQLIDPLEQGLLSLEADPSFYRAYNPKNGWGKYENLLAFVRDYLNACIEYPDAEISVNR